MSQPKLVGIVAMTSERVIGKDGDLPWHLPEDLKFFKKTTSRFPILMGRKTYDSIGRPLPKRRNVVITRDESWIAEGVDVIHQTADLSSLKITEEKIFIIGGAEIYKIFLPILDELIVSKVKENFEGNTYFPEFEPYFSKEEILEEFEDFAVVRYSHTTRQK